MLIGDTIVGFLVLDRGDEPYLRIGPTDDADLHGVTHPRYATVGGNGELCADGISIRQGGFDRSAGSLERGDAARRNEAEVRQGIGDVIESAADMPVFDDVAHRHSDLAGVE